MDKCDRQQRFYEMCVNVLRGAGYSVLPLRLSVIGPDGRAVEMSLDTLITMAQKHAQQEAQEARS